MSIGRLITHICSMLFMLYGTELMYSINLHTVVVVFWRKNNIASALLGNIYMLWNTKQNRLKSKITYMISKSHKKRSTKFYFQDVAYTYTWTAWTMKNRINFLRKCKWWQRVNINLNTSLLFSFPIKCQENLIDFVLFLLLIFFFHKFCADDFSKTIRPISTIFSQMIRLDMNLIHFW